MSSSAEGTRSSGRGQKLVALDSCGHAAPVLVGLDTNNFRKASNVDVASHGDFTGQSENEFYGRSRCEVVLNQKVEAAETDVPRLSLPLVPARLWRANR